MEEVKLFRVWSSPFSCRVECALKLKGVNCELVDEDLSNKSPLLLQYNPVYKKIPVLVHGGKPISESMIIVQYIDETWPNQSLLPIDPFERSLARFWTKFVEDKCVGVWPCFRTIGEEQEKAIKETFEMLRTIEEHGGLSERKFLGGDAIGLADLAFGIVAYWFEVIGDVIEVKFIEPHTFPHIYSYINRFKEVPEIKETLPNYDELVVFFKHRREMYLSLSK